MRNGKGSISPITVSAPTATDPGSACSEVQNAVGVLVVTEAGIDPKVSAVVYVAARAPDAGEDYTALASTFPAPPAAAGIVFDGDEGRLGEAAFLHDFAGDLSEAE